MIDDTPNPQPDDATQAADDTPDVQQTDDDTYFEQAENEREAAQAAYLDPVNLTPAQEEQLRIEGEDAGKGD